VHLGLTAVVVSEYDLGISFFMDRLGFEVVENAPALRRASQAVGGSPVARAATGLLSAGAHGEDPAAIVGKQATVLGVLRSREGFDAAYAGLASAGVHFVTAPRTEPYGHVAVFLEIASKQMRPF
jgi:Glyoxalase/Bleomycin resistance protein/Dioxygenase superfamily